MSANRLECNIAQWTTEGGKLFMCDFTILNCHRIFSPSFCSYFLNRFARLHTGPAAGLRSLQALNCPRLLRHGCKPCNRHRQLSRMVYLVWSVRFLECGALHHFVRCGYFRSLLDATAAWSAGRSHRYDFQMDVQHNIQHCGYSSKL